MIISVSRRTDIPAFYSQWFMNRIHEGFVDSVNPFNRKQVTRVNLSPQSVDCIVFWTKDAAPMLPYLEELDNLGYKYYFQFTITPYDRDVEVHVRNKKDIIKTFQQLSQRIGKHRVVWRYDPILLTEKYSIDKHIQSFAGMAKELAPYTDTCVISFLDLYKKTERNTAKLHLQKITPKTMYELATAISTIANQYKLEVQSCSEEIDLDVCGVKHGACIDLRHVEAAMGCNISLNKDRTQRSTCGCAKSLDIGQYNTCFHLCSYCYANFNIPMVNALRQQHNPTSSILIGYLLGDEKITECHLKPVQRISVNEQFSLF